MTYSNLCYYFHFLLYKLRSQQGTCYMEDASPSTDVPPPPSSAHIPFGSHSSPTVAFLSMHHHLTGCFDHFSPTHQLVVMAALRRCDDDINKLMLNICDCQMRAVEEVKCIVRDARSNAPPTPGDKGDVNVAKSPVIGVHIESNLHDARQHSFPTSGVGNARNVVPNEGHDTLLDTGDLSFTQLITTDGLDRFLSSQKGTIIWVL